MKYSGLDPREARAYEAAIAAICELNRELLEDICLGRARRKKRAKPLKAKRK